MSNTALIEVREEILPLRSEFTAILPAHITPDKFMQTVLTAVEREPDLLNADRASLMIAAKEAASDGLLPDKKEGAFVVYKTKKMIPNPRGGHSKIEVTVDEVKWMPMILGIRKKMFQTGKVKDIQVELVYEHDTYRRAAGDNAEIFHEPLDFGDRGKIKGGYAIIQTLEGGVFREVMSLEQIEGVEKSAKTGKVWGGPFRTEMMRKTILRRLAKQVPLSAEVDRVLSRDDALYDFGATGAAARLDAAASTAIPKTSLFGNKAHVKARAKPLEIETVAEVVDAESKPAAAAEIPAEEGPTEEGNPELPEAITKIMHAESASDLFEAVFAAHALPDLNQEEIDWIKESEAAQRAVLELPDPNEPEEEEEAANDGFVLAAIITTQVGAKAYTDAAVWRDDILTKLNALGGPEKKAFVAKNWPFIRAAEAHCPEEVARIVKVLGEHNLIPSGGQPHD